MENEELKIAGNVEPQPNYDTAQENTLSDDTPIGDPLPDGADTPPGDPLPDGADAPPVPPNYDTQPAPKRTRLGGWQLLFTLLIILTIPVYALRVTGVALQLTDAFKSIFAPYPNSFWGDIDIPPEWAGVESLLSTDRSEIFSDISMILTNGALIIIGIAHLVIVAALVFQVLFIIQSFRRKPSFLRHLQTAFMLHIGALMLIAASGAISAGVVMAFLTEAQDLAAIFGAIDGVSLGEVVQALTALTVIVALIALPIALHMRAARKKPYGHAEKVFSVKSVVGKVIKFIASTVAALSVCFGTVLVFFIFSEMWEPSSVSFRALATVFPSITGWPRLAFGVIEQSFHVVVAVLAMVLITLYFRTSRRVRAYMNGEEYAEKALIVKGKIKKAVALIASSYAALALVIVVLFFAVAPETASIGGFKYRTDMDEIYIVMPYVNNENIQELSKMTNLTDLFMMATSVSDLSPLSNLTQLESVSLGSNLIEDVSPLGGLVNLDFLDLSNNQISDIGGLSGLINLRSLDLSNDDNDYILDGLDELSEASGVFTQMRSDFTGNNQVSDLSPLSNLTSLRNLFIQNNPVSDLSPLAGLPSLVYINISGTQVRDVSPLAGSPDFAWLVWNESNVSDISSLSSLAGLEHFRNFDMQNNQISDIGVLEGFPSLRIVDLSDNRISDISPLSGSPVLRTLRLQNNQISDISPLRDCPELSSLYLSGNQISDVSPLRDLPSLTRIDLTGNPLTDAQIDELREALPDCDIIWEAA